MRKLVLRAAIVLGVLFVLFVAIGFCLPGSYRVQRSVVIDAEPIDIYQRVATLRTWANWTTWTTENYPTLRYRYEGPVAGVGVGAVQTWTAEEMGGGRLEIVAAEPGESIAYEMQFEGFDEPLFGRFEFEPVADGTRVTWIAEGKLGWSPAARYFGLMFDSMLGPDFETGLQNLKRATERILE